MARRNSSRERRGLVCEIVVDSSACIDLLNGRGAPHVRYLRAILGAEEIVVGDALSRFAASGG